MTPRKFTKREYINNFDGTMSLIIDGSKGKFIVTFDACEYNKVKDFNWYIYAPGKKPVTIKANHPNGKLYDFARVVMGKTDSADLVKFKSGDRLDLRKSNLYIQPRKGVRCEKQTPYVLTNKENIPGVTFLEKAGNPYWMAQLKQKGRKVKRTFSINVHGNDEAKLLAATQVEHWKKLREQGVTLKNPDHFI